MKGRILIIDDEKNILSTLSDILVDDGHFVSIAGCGAEGLKVIRDKEIDIVLLDIRLPDYDGIELLKQIKSKFSGIEIIMISGHASVSIAVKATKLGAYDFIEKPLSVEKVRIAVTNALEKKKLVFEKEELGKIWLEGYEILGESSAIMGIKVAIKQCAGTESKVLISGETGTGKELVAVAIHYNSGRRGAPFVRVNCAAIPETLMESELFGHEKGAFTGAISRRAGKFELANGGTIFLDEIGDMELSCQAKVLRVLESGDFERVGGVSSIKVDVRVIGASNKDLLKQVSEGKFRGDLYYRLNVVPIYIPPLRERRTDIPLLIEHFILKFYKERGLSPRKLDKKALSLLSSYDYPGNIRELRNIVERLAVMGTKEIIGEAEIINILGAKKGGQDIFTDTMTLADAQHRLVKKYIENQLVLHNYNIRETAGALGLARTNLYRKMRDLGIETK